MRKLILTGILIGLVYASCETTETKNTSVTSDTPAADAIVVDKLLYSCPMHPHITGNRGDTCSECGMDLTETSKTGDGTVDAAAIVYACSMHPEVTGTKDEKCSKCGMALTEVVKK